MPIFMIERRFADELEVNAGVADGVRRVNEEEGVQWLYSFLSADKRKTYCLYEAPRHRQSDPLPSAPACLPMSSSRSPTGCRRAGRWSPLIPRPGRPLVEQTVSGRVH